MRLRAVEMPDAPATGNAARRRPALAHVATRDVPTGGMPNAPVRDREDSLATLLTRSVRSRRGEAMPGGVTPRAQRLLQRKITDDETILSIRKLTAELAPTVGVTDAGVTATVNVVVDKLDDASPWATVEAGLRAALAARAVLEQLATMDRRPSQHFGDTAPPGYAKAVEALRNTTAKLAVDPAAAGGWADPLGMTMVGVGGLQFLEAIRLPRFVERAVARIDAEQQLATTLPKHPRLAHVRPEDAWRLLMDADAQAARGPFGFENEPGYMAAMMRALKHMLDTLDEPFTADLFEKLHQVAVTNVQSRSNEPFDHGFRSTMTTVSFGGLLGKTFTINGLGQLDRASSGWEDWFAVERADEKVLLKHLAKSRDEVVKRVSTIIDTYNRAILEADSDEKKLQIILTCCQDLELAHTFSDGNLRTVAFLVLNRLLLLNDLNPTLLDDPNKIDGHTVQELIPLVQEGQTRVRDVGAVTIK